MKRFFSRYGLIFVIAIAWLIVGYKCAAGQTVDCYTQKISADGLVLVEPCCPQGYVYQKVIGQQFYPDSIGYECKPDPKYWEYVTTPDHYNWQFDGTWQRIDSMWTMRVDSIADTVPVWQMIKVGQHILWPDSLTDFMPYFVPDSALVRVGSIRYRVDTSWVAKQ